MNDLLDLMRKCSWLFTTYRFRFIDSDVSESFGNAAIRLVRRGVTLHSVRDSDEISLDVGSDASESFGNATIRLVRGGVTLHFVRDRGEISLDVGVVEDGKVVGKEYSLALIREWMTGEREVSGLLDDENLDFLRDNIKLIISRFTWGNVDETREALQQFLQVRPSRR